MYSRDESNADHAFCAQRTHPSSDLAFESNNVARRHSSAVDDRPSEIEAIELMRRARMARYET